MVVGLGETLMNSLDGQVPGLRTFRGIEGALVQMPAAPPSTFWFCCEERPEGIC